MKRSASRWKAESGGRSVEVFAEKIGDDYQINEGLQLFNKSTEKEARRRTVFTKHRQAAGHLLPKEAVLEVTPAGAFKTRFEVWDLQPIENPTFEVKISAKTK